MSQSSPSALQRNPSNEENSEYQVGKNWGEINHLRIDDDGLRSMKLPLGGSWEEKRIRRLLAFENWLHERRPIFIHTFPDDWIPFITMQKTTSQLISKHITIHHFNPWPSSIVGDASRVTRYQKYAVSELFAHSSTGFPFTSGQEAHNKGSYRQQSIL